MTVRSTLSLICFFSLFHVSLVQARLPEPVWHSGQLTSWDKTVFEGDICYNWLMETVLIRQPDGRIHTFSASQISQFGWFDAAANARRTFKVLRTDLPDGRSSEAIFEVYMDGPLTVVRRIKKPQGLRKHLFNHPTYFSDQPGLSQSAEFFNYFVYDAGRLRAIDRFYTDVYEPLMTTYKKQLTAYVQAHNLNDRTLLGRLILIGRYNILVEQDAKTASAKVPVVSP